MPAKYERVKIKLPHAKKIHGKSIVFLLKEADTERRRRSSRENTMYKKLNLELMDNKTQFWQNTVNSLNLFYSYIYQKTTWYYILSSLRYNFFLIYVLFNDAHLQLFQQTWSLYKQK